MDGDFQNSSSTKSRFQTAIWTVKVAFLFIGIISTALLLKLGIPYSLNILLSSLPRLWISFRTWLSPPYLYIVVNFIIIGIAASSSFQQKPSEKTRNNNEEDQVAEINNNNDLQHKRIDATDSSSSQKTLLGLWTDSDEHVVVSDVAVKSSSDDSSRVAESDGRAASEAKNRTVSARSGSRKASPEKMAEISPVKTSKPKKSNDSLDDTWQAITGGAKPPARQLKKSDTWNAPPPEPEPELERGLARRELRKSDTFSDTASSISSGSAASSRGSGGLRREFVLSQDELNRRVEAFIEKFNHDMRLERQESLKQQRMEMVNRVVY